MTVYQNASIGSGGQPNRPNALRLATLDAVLVAGAATVNLPGFDDNALVFVSRAVAGGVIGNLSCDRNPANGDILITSSNAGDTSTVYVLVIGGM